jgi:2-hydroxy-6-oxonona-2,4-dienedioate hydrolase
MKIKHDRIRFSWIELKNGETIAFRQKGQGDTAIILVHGNTGSSKHWRLLMEQLPEHYAVYAPDLRGFGDSTYTEPIQSIEDFSKDLFLFAEAMELKSFILAGWSLGGAVCMQFAAEHPKMVKKLILMASAGVQGFPVSKRGLFKRPISGQYLTDHESLYKELKPMVKAMRQRTDWIIRTALDFSLFNVQRPSHEHQDELVRVVFQQRNLVDVNYALAYFNISHESNGVVDGNGMVDNIIAPTLVLQGDRDMVVNQEIAETTVNSIGENARLVILGGCGHYPLLDDIDAVSKEYLSFIENHEGERLRRIKINVKNAPVLEKLGKVLVRLNPLRPHVDIP